MEIKFYRIGEVSNSQFNFAVIFAAYKGKWIFVRHEGRNTWEVPGGHREKNEDINVTASRELFEETGALNYKIEPVCDYSVTIDEITIFGRLLYAKVNEMGPLPDSEICEVSFFKMMPDNLTYADIQPILLRKVLDFLSGKVLKLLEKDKTRNINIINFIRNYPIYTFETVGDSVLVRGRSDEDWVYISSKSYDEFFKLIYVLDGDDKCFAAIEDWMLPHIVKNRKIKSRLTSMKLVYDSNVPLLTVKSHIVDLSIADAPYIFENSKYKEYISIEYIEDRIKNGIGLGIYENEKLVVWAITHDDGAIGFLNVLEDYRRKGYGMDVTIAMTKRLLELGELPFVHIEEDNVKSMNLALKAGFRKDRRVHWIKLN